MELSEGLLELLSEGCLCDVNLVAGDGAVVKAHKVVLAARSNYLRARLTGPWSESQDSSTVRLPDIAGSTLEICVKVLYSNDVHKAIVYVRPVLACFSEKSDLSGIEALLHTMQFLDAPKSQTIVEAAIFYKDEYKAAVQHHIFALWKIAAETNANELKRNLETIAEMCLRKIVKGPQAPEIATLPFPVLLRIVRMGQPAALRSNAAACPVAFWLVGLWLRLLDCCCSKLSHHKRKPRVSFMESLHKVLQSSMGSQEGPKASCHWAAGDPRTRLSVLQKWVLREWANGCSTLIASPSVINDTLELLLRQEKPEYAELKSRVILPMQAFAQHRQTALQAPHVPNSILVCGGRGADWVPVRASERLFEGSSSWVTAQSYTTGSAFVCGVDIPGGMFTLTNASAGSQEAKYDAVSNQWLPASSALSSQPASHLHAAIARLADRVYVLGGKRGVQSSVSALSDVSIFSLLTRCWARGTALREPRCCHGAAALEGRLYVAGGQPARHLMRSLDHFDLELDRWEPGPRLLEERKYLGLGAFGGRLIAVGGMTSERMRLASVEALDPREPHGWSPLPSMSTARSSSGVAILNGKVYVVGGTDVNDQPLASVEAFDFAAGRWMAMPSLLTARTGHAVAII